MKRSSREHHEDHMDETWLIPYADLLTLLLALFIVLFASSQIDQKKFDQLSKSLNEAFNGGISFFQPSTIVPVTQEGLEKNKDSHKYDEPSDTSRRRKNAITESEKIRQETEDLKELKQQLDAYIQNNQLEHQLETKLNNRQLKITIGDNTLFPSGSATVKPEAQTLAVAISNMLEKYPGYQIVISGHTDNNPIHTKEFPSNWDLSSKRALNFMKILLQNDNLAPKRFSAVGFGEYRPIASNDTAEGRAANRRVEVSIMRNIQSPNSSDLSETPPSSTN